MTPKEHAKVLGLLFWIYAGFNLVMMLVSLVVVMGVFGVAMSDLSTMPRRAGEPNPEAFFWIFAVIMIIALISTIVMSIPNVVAGHGLRNDRGWAKIWAVIASCLALLGFPLGTALGVYGLWFIFSEQGAAYFNNPEGRLTTPPAPPAGWQ